MSQGIFTVAVAIVAGVASYLAARITRPKIEAEAKEILGKAYKGLIGELREEIQANHDAIASLRRELEAERRHNRQLEAWAKALVAQINELGHDPIPYETFRRE